MAEHTPPPRREAEAVSDAPHRGVNRRSIVRAGLAAGPVVAALKSNTVLAADVACIRPSSYASIAPATQVSYTPQQYTSADPTYWKTHTTTALSKSTNFISTTTGFTAGGTTQVTYPNPGGVLQTRNLSMLSLQQVLDSTGGADGSLVELARYVTAHLLTAKAYGSAAVLSVAQCQACWNGLAGASAIWSKDLPNPPYPGVSWTLDQTLAYFRYLDNRANCGVAA